VHTGDQKGRTWVWDIAEHLVMAAHVLPLVVKLTLEQEKHYVLTDDDHAACLATDPLLVATQWVDNRDETNDEAPSWQKILSKTKLDFSFDRAWENYKKSHHEAFREDSNKSAEPVEPASAERRQE